MVKIDNLTCQLTRDDRFSTMSLFSVLVGGPYLGIQKGADTNTLYRTWMVESHKYSTNTYSQGIQIHLVSTKRTEK